MIVGHILEGDYNNINTVNSEALQTYHRTFKWHKELARSCWALAARTSVIRQAHAAYYMLLPMAQASLVGSNAPNRTVRAQTCLGWCASGLAPA